MLRGGHGPRGASGGASGGHSDILEADLIVRGAQLHLKGICQHLLIQQQIEGSSSEGA